MFVVRCPATTVWHPTVHHSLLLLRALQQPHTLQLDPHSATHGRLPVPLLSESAMAVSVHFQQQSLLPGASITGPAQPSGCTLYRPEDVLHVLRGPPKAWSGPCLAPEVLAATSAALTEYLEAAAVSAHVMSAVDALLVALNTGDMETIRQTNARVMELVERLDSALSDDESHAGAGKGDAEPLSTWPLFSTLQFLIEEGGLLMSAFPQTSKAYTRLSNGSNKAIALHRQLIRRTVEAQLADRAVASGSAAHADLAAGEEGYPARGFLRDAQRHLAAYNRSMEETTTEGVTGDKGPLRSRVSGGRLGVQAVPARLPWTLRGVPLRKP